VTKAEEEGVSLNALVTYLLSQSVNLEKTAGSPTD
jgi:predicted HicB family RNase H-like nuclease